MGYCFQDYEAIKELLDRYFEAVGKADVDTLKTIFHENASMYGYLGPDAVIGTPEIFYADISSKPSMKEQGIDCRCVVKRIEIQENIADAIITVDNFYGAARVEDHFHLLKLDGKWRILCKTFTTF